MTTLEADEMIEITVNDQGEKMVGLSSIERRRGRDVFDFFCFLIWPFIEAAWLGAVSLISLTPPLNTPPDILIEMSKAQDSAQLVRFFEFSHHHHHQPPPLTTNSNPSFPPFPNKNS